MNPRPLLTLLLVTVGGIASGALVYWLYAGRIDSAPMPAVGSGSAALPAQHADSDAFAFSQPVLQAGAHDKGSVPFPIKS